MPKHEFVTQELAIEVNGISRETVLNLVETHGNVTYRYTAVNGEKVEISFTHYTDPKEMYEVEIDTGSSGSMMSYPYLTSAIDWFFELIEQNPAAVSVEDEDGNRDASES